MTNTELSQLERTLRRGADTDVGGAAQAATLAAIAAADREGIVDVGVATIESPVGDLFVAVSGRVLVRVAYDPVDALDELAARVSPRVVEAPGKIDPVRRQLDEYFEARRRRFELDVDLSLATAFGRRVLEATARVPAGEVVTYGELAARIGKPRAARAVGNALGANPVAIVVPCHRVVPAGGGVGNYGGGPERKAFLLDLEHGDTSLTARR
jgi:methylated-DNA-[protein]-cysteine S-methyltransferase